MNETPEDMAAAAVDTTAYPSAYDIFGAEVQLMSGRALPLGEEPPRTASPQEVFGECSTTAAYAMPEPAHAVRLCHGEVFQISVLALAAAYMAMLLRSANHMRTIVGAIFHSTGADQSIVENCRSAALTRFMGGVMLFGVLLAGAIFVRLADIAAGDAAGGVPAAIRTAAPLIAAAAVAAMILWQYLLHKITAWVCRSDAVRSLGNLSYLYFAAGTLLLFPLSASMLLGDRGVSSIWVIMSLAGIMIVCILYLKDTFMFFMSKNISILYWFLYLCGVVALPMSFAYVIASDI